VVGVSQTRRPTTHHRFALDPPLTPLRELAVVLAILFLYAFFSNVALAVVPHEPVVVWYGRQVGIWPTAIVATAGTVAASWFDHRAFSGLIARLAASSQHSPSWLKWVRIRFARAPFAVIACSALTPLPFFPFKALAFAEGVPLMPYLGAVAVGRLPRYLLLAWLGYQLKVPAWVFLAVSLPFLIPTFKRWICPRQRVS
jgi:membrane protein YqaA with SNARE-associated domain